MNVVNKLVTLGIVKLTSAIVDDTPEHINFMYGFILWIALPLIGLLPGFLVEEDLRRLNMKDVKKSQWVEERVLLAKTDEELKVFYKENKIIAGQDVLDHFFIIEGHRSYRETIKSERLTEDDNMSYKSRRKSEDLRASGQHQPLIRSSTYVSKKEFDRMSKSIKSNSDFL